MIRAFFSILLLIVFAVIAATFASVNQGPIGLDLIFVKVEVEKSQAFVLTLVVGWILGALSATLLVLKLMGDRRKLRKQARLAEAEADNLRSLPLRDGS